MKKENSLKEKINGEPIHSRSLDLKTYPLDDDKIIVEGWLKDDRLQVVYHFDGSRQEGGLVHHMAVRLLVGGLPPTILDAEAEMIQVPNEPCPSTLESVKKMIGVKIQSGFGEKVHQMIAGTEGCAHLAHLVIVMGQEAVHGLWTHKNRKPRPIPRSIKEVEGLTSLINSCYLWREDGPLLGWMKEAIKTHWGRESDLNYKE